MVLLECMDSMARDAYIPSTAVLGDRYGFNRIGVHLLL